MHINIPKVIDDYNHWIIGVDVADKLIAYYRLCIRHRRTCISLMFHCLEISSESMSLSVRNVLNEILGFVHNEFLFEFIDALLDRASDTEFGRGTRSTLIIDKFRYLARSKDRWVER